MEGYMIEVAARPPLLTGIITVVVLYPILSMLVMGAVEIVDWWAERQSIIRDRGTITKKVWPIVLAPGWVLGWLFLRTQFAWPGLERVWRFVVEWVVLPPCRLLGWMASLPERACQHLFGQPFGFVVGDIIVGCGCAALVYVLLLGAGKLGWFYLYVLGIL